MRKLTDRKIKRLLSAGGTPEPPPSLAERIKAEIPEVLQTGGGQSPKGMRDARLRPNVLRPLWLLAASLLVMIGAGFVAVRFLAPRSDLAREIALGGVVRIKDIVVTVPKRSTVQEEQPVAAGEVTDRALAFAYRSVPKAAPMGLAAKTTSKGSPQVTSSRTTGSLAVTVTDGAERLPGVKITATRADATGAPSLTVVSGPDGRATVQRLVPGDYRVRTELQGFQERDVTLRVAGGREDRIHLEMPKQKVSEEVTVTGSLVPMTAMATTATTNAASAPAPPIAEATKGSIVVTVRDADGKPLKGATVMLAFSDRPDVGCGFRVTGRAGVATFCCVLPHAYRMCAQLRGFLPAAKDGIEVSSGRQIEVEITMVRPPADGKEYPWTCPPPGPSVTH
jgi:hypothetical protein